MTLRTTAAALAATAILVLPAAPASAAKGQKTVVREFTGTVTVAKGKTFTLRRSGRAPVRVRLASKTRVATGARPRKGRKLVVKAARRAGKGWVARSVKLVPVAVDEDDEFADEEEPLEEEPVADEEESDDSGPGLDLEDTFEDLLPGSGDEEE